MAESIVLTEGSKVRQDGKSYKVVNSTVIDGELVETKTQKNRHAAFGCPGEECKEKQPVFRCGARKKIDTGAWRLPDCGHCGTPMVWIDEPEPGQ